MYFSLIFSIFAALDLSRLSSSSKDNLISFILIIFDCTFCNVVCGVYSAEYCIVQIKSAALKLAVCQFSDNVKTFSYQRIVAMTEFN
ncbi:hypothetical protein [Eubacterium sp.]|uniref:hypothetical protein n=1 Tax=Eubacterium sp. TaxID=142586 RepID=UPI00402546D8